MYIRNGPSHVQSKYRVRNHRLTQLTRALGLFSYSSRKLHLFEESRSCFPRLLVNSDDGQCRMRKSTSHKILLRQRQAMKNTSAWSELETCFMHCKVGKTSSRPIRAPTRPAMQPLAESGNTRKRSRITTDITIQWMQGADYEFPRKMLNRLAQQVRLYKMKSLADTSRTTKAFTI